MSGKEKAWGPLLRVECELGERPEALSSRLSVMSGRAWGSLLQVECDVWAKPKALSSGANVSQLISRVRYPLTILLMWQDTCHDLAEWSESDHYRPIKGLTTAWSWSPGWALVSCIELNACYCWTHKSMLLNRAWQVFFSDNTFWGRLLYLSSSWDLLGVCSWVTMEWFGVGFWWISIISNL